MTQAVMVYLPSTVEYVTGTVNGAVTEWQYTGEKWQTIAERSSDDVYRVEITAYTAQGGNYNYSMMLYLGLHLITDRTQDDADRYDYLHKRLIEAGVAALTSDELNEWFSGLRGAYNATDLNRVEDAVRQLTNMLSDLGYTAFTTPPSEIWAMSKVPSEAEMLRYLNNVAEICKGYHTPQAAPPLPDSMGDLTFEGANAIERILLEVYDMIQRMVADFTYSGEIYSGEDDWV